MQTKTYNVYKYNELNKEQQQKVLENLYSINVECDWWSDFVIEDETEKLNKYGFEDIKIYFSGFWSQGDGACFIGSLDNDGLLKFLTETKELTKYKTLVKAIRDNTIYVNIKITHNFRYYHEYSTDINDYTEMQDNSELTGNLLKEYTEWYKSFDRKGSHNESIGWYYDTCRDIYNRLKKAYEYQTSEEAIIETIKANDYDFTEDGQID